MKKRILLIFLVFTIIAFLSGCSKFSQIEKGEAKPVIKVGSDNYPPFIYQDEEGNAIGIDVEIAKEAFGRLGYQVEFVLINWEQKKELVDSGVIDCIMGCFTMQGRIDLYNWAGPYMASNQIIAVNNNSDIYTLSDLEGKNVAVQSTTKPEELFLKGNNNYPKLANLISLKQRELIFTFLGKGYVDAIAAHETSVLQQIKDYDINIRILEEPIMTVGIGVAFSKNDDRGLSQELNTVLEEMKTDGKLENIIGKYLQNPKKYLEVENLEF